MKTKNILITTAIIAAIGYAVSYNPNGIFFVPVAKLIKEKGKIEDSRVHSLDLRKLRSPTP